ncbi:hybrid sensor histidine kinase/response regulator transcription factor [Roseimarinus sediminis]|uniref:hybrid sensor histidine kinase/response regulator transcription factor n=1 Tax=Roseimarinus sediminis TaxID=1610899 RepID=UPI003D1C45B6
MLKFWNAAAVSTLLLLCLLLPAKAQQAVVIKDLTAGTDLPEGAINCIVQDQSGYLWIGTWKGLYRYDGYRAINFSSINPQFDALKIGTLLIDNNQLWVGSFVTGLFRIDLSTYASTSYLTSNESTRRISDNNVITLAALADHTVLVGTERGGMNVIAASGEVIKTYTRESHPNLLNSNQVSVITPVDQQTVALGNNALVLLDLKKEVSYKYKHPLFEQHFSEIEPIAPGEYLISNNTGLYLLNMNEVNAEPLLLLNERFKSIIRKNDFNNKHTLLLGSQGGLYEFNLNNRKLSEYVSNRSTGHSQSDINQILFTHKETLLLAREDGLYSLLPRKHHFRQFNTPGSEHNPAIISAIDMAGTRLLAGSWGKGIFRINDENKQLEAVSFKAPAGGEVPRFIFTMKTIDDKVWTSGKNHLGIFSFPTHSSPYPLTYYPQFRGPNNTMDYYTVTSLCQSAGETLLLGTWEGLLFYYHEQRDEFVVLTDLNGQLPYSKDLSIYTLLEDKNGFTWVGLSGGGLIKMKIEGNTILSQERFTLHDGLASNFVTTLYQSRNNKIWVGTEAGLSVVENDTIRSVYNKDLIFDIQSIIEDPIGFLWIGTQKGLIRINSNHLDEPFKLFDSSDGLQNNAFYLNSIYAGNDYTFYFGGYKGIDYFTPYKIEYNYNKPLPKITSFSLFNQEIYPGSDKEHQPLEKNITLSDEIRLKYNQNTFSLEFSNLEYQVQEKCQFSYLLDGVDIDWTYRDAQHRFAYYTKLDPGTYTFYLQSTNNDGVWSDEPVALTIIIEPPFWATTWAYSSYIVLFMLSVFFIIYNRVMKVQEKHKQQLKEVEFRKQQELDELKLRFFTNISHEFRTPLTLILGPLARILENESKDPYKEKHLMIYRNASRLLQLTNRIMDFRKNEKDQLKLKVEPTNLSEFIYNIYLFFNYEAQKRNIDYRFKTTYEGSVYIDQEFIESVTFNLLSNAFKYTPDGRSITLSVKGDEQKVSITVADTGRGIKNDALLQIFDRFYGAAKRNSAGIGLSFSKRLIELHKGDIRVESTEGEGSEFTIELPAADVYSNEEKNNIENRELVIDWTKIDQSLRQKVNEEFSGLKSLYEKEELIALIADDNFEVRQFIRSLLEKDFRVIEAANGKQALDLAFEHIPDIVISDIMMPGMDGLELCQHLKSDQRTDHIPVVITTVLSSQTDRIEGLSKGADSYIPKPIDPGHLIVRVNKLIEKQLKLKEKFNLRTVELKKEEFTEAEEEMHPLVEKARNIVLSNIDNSDYNIDDFCSDLGLSRMQLYRKFKAITGLSANSFIRKVRLHKAAELLKSGHLTVKEVTYDVGFIDLKYFRKCFNDEFGLNPSEYAQHHEHKK